MQDDCVEELERVRLEVLERWARNGSLVQEGVESVKGLYIFGAVGGGKTMLMDLLCESLRDTPNAPPIRRTHFHEFILDMHKRLHRVRQEVGSIQNPMRVVAKQYEAECPVLFFDEMHVLNVGDAMILKAFFEELFASGCVVVATSNLRPMDLYSSGINREVFLPFTSTLEKHCTLFDMEGTPDYRSVRNELLAEAARSGDGVLPAFFAPEGPSTGRRVEEALALLGAEGPGEARKVECAMGRTLAVPRSWGRIAEFQFVDLCEKFLGVPDYLAIAENFDIIALRGVPQFTDSAEDAARRLVLLVDILYDQSKQMVVSADVPVDEIFGGLKKKYQHDSLAGSEAEHMDEEDDFSGTVRVPDWGGSSGRHFSVFKRPKTQRYGVSGTYHPGTGAEPEEVAEQGAVAATGGRHDRGAGGGPVMAGQVEEHTEWVEWSATGLKDASMYDLTCHTRKQQHDRLLPLLRCQSRMKEMSHVALAPRKAA